MHLHPHRSFRTGSVRPTAEAARSAIVRQESPDTVRSATAASISGPLHRHLSLWNRLTLGVDACSTIAEETHEPKRIVPRARALSLCMVGGVMLFNSAALTLSFNRDTAQQTSPASDPVTPVIVHNFGAWAESPFLPIIMIVFLACGSPMVPYTSRIRFSMVREDSMPAILSQVIAAAAPRNAQRRRRQGEPKAKEQRNHQPAKRGDHHENKSRRLQENIYGYPGFHCTHSGAGVHAASCIRWRHNQGR